MRLVLKLTAVLFAIFVAVLAGQATLNWQRIAEVVEHDAKDDLAHLSSGLSEAVEQLWGSGGREAAARYVRRVDEARMTFTIRLRPPSVPVSDHIQRLQPGEVVSRHPVFRIRRAIMVAGKQEATLELNREVSEEASFMAALTETQVTTTIIFAVLAGAVSFLFGNWVIGRPLRALGRQAQHLAEGELSARNEVRQRDEIGTLGKEFNAMAEKLGLAEEEVRKERHVRTQAMAELRHSDRLSTVGKLASAMAHELGTPLNVVAGRTTMIEQDSSSNEAVRRNARIIREQAERMAQLIRELLDFARKNPLTHTELRVADVVERARSLMEPLCDERGVEVQCSGELDRTVYWDENKVLQVLTNLMMNAVQAMPDGGKLVLHATRETIEDPSDRHASAGEYVRLSVEDDGVGIEKERLPDIFKPFFTTKLGSGGTGLGLSVCQGIVREHGGWMEVDSIRGEGSTFSVLLPTREE